jgi:hypothetical protein
MQYDIEPYKKAFQECFDKQMKAVENGYNPSFAMEALLFYLQIGSATNRKRVEAIRNFERGLIHEFADKYALSLQQEPFYDIICEKNRIDIL